MYVSYAMLHDFNCIPGMFVLRSAVKYFEVFLNVFAWLNKISHEVELFYFIVIYEYI